MVTIIRRADALARGVTDAELRRHCRTGAYVALRPGVYVSGAEFEALTPVEQHRVIAESVIGAAVTTDAVLSHVSAAILHGLAVWNLPLAAVHITRNRMTGGRTNPQRHVHASPYAPDDAVRIDGLPVTSLARTVVDLARTYPFEEAVCAADDAARRGLTREQMNEQLARCPSHPGNARAARVTRFMDARSDSVGESRSRVMLHEHGFAPTIQHHIVCGAKVYLADFYIADGRVVGEFDGRAKYGRLVSEGDTPGDVLWREKRREDAIRDRGFEVVRWTWADLYSPRVIVDRIRRAQNRNRS